MLTQHPCHSESEVARGRHSVHPGGAFISCYTENMTNRGELFDSWRKGQESYQTSEHNRELLASKHFSAIVGPAGIGKSTAMQRATELDPSFTVVGTGTSRPQRSNDNPELYTYIITDEDFEKLQKDIEQKEIIQYAIDPTNDVIYLSRPEDYPGTYNLGDVWASAVPSFQRLGFKTLTTIALVAEPEDWEQWFHQRFHIGDDTAKRRIREAQMALTMLIDSPFAIKWLLNKNGTLDQTAQGIIDLSRGGHSQVDGPAIAKNMLEAAKRLEKEYGA